jgi:hypothetical protein
LWAGSVETINTCCINNKKDCIFKMFPQYLPDTTKTAAAATNSNSNSN